MDGDSEDLNTKEPYLILSPHSPQLLIVSIRQRLVSTKFLRKYIEFSTHVVLSCELGRTSNISWNPRYARNWAWLCRRCAYRPALRRRQPRQKYPSTRLVFQCIHLVLEATQEISQKMADLQALFYFCDGVSGCRTG